MVHTSFLCKLCLMVKGMHEGFPWLCLVVLVCGFCGGCFFGLFVVFGVFCVCFVVFVFVFVCVCVCVCVPACLFFFNLSIHPLVTYLQLRNIFVQAYINIISCMKS